MWHMRGITSELGLIDKSLTVLVKHSLNFPYLMSSLDIILHHSRSITPEFAIAAHKKVKLHFFITWPFAAAHKICNNKNDD